MKRGKSEVENCADLVESPVSWDEQGQPCSKQFGDIYHTRSGAVKQADHVFLQGCGLPQRWQGQEHFTIVETGFGLGLNFLTTWLRWQEDAQRCKRLHFISIEAYPVSVEDMRKALAMFIELEELGQRLLAVYADFQKTQKRMLCDEAVNFPVWEVSFFDADGYELILTLALGDVRTVLPELNAFERKADALYLDGFSPAKNPEMWGQEVCDGLAGVAKVGTHIATWCVASPVRACLSAAGFEVQRVVGLPPKRNALVGRFKIV